MSLSGAAPRHAQRGDETHLLECKLAFSWGFPHFNRIKSEIGLPGLPGVEGRKGKRGPPGPRGAAGPIGEIGVVGKKGPEGVQGTRGPAGVPGEIGIVGKTGPVGPMGPIGMKGSPGKTGSRKLNSNTGVQGIVGEKGDFGLKGYEGAIGLPGLAGARGISGAPGDSGLKGTRGSKGARGDDGDRGENGEEGPAGNIGAQGGEGPRGEQGNSGMKGPRGDVGPTGLPGPAGPSTLSPSMLSSLFTLNTGEKGPGNPGVPLPMPSTPSTNGPSGVDINNIDVAQPFGDDVLADNPLKTATNFINDLKNVGKEVKLKTKPDGSVEHPAKSCRDIAEFYPEKLNGKYYIDPNEGSKDDAVLVHCELTKRMTCIKAKQASFKPSTRLLSNSKTATKKHVRFMEDLLQQPEFEYDIETIQLRFLRMLSDKAYQNITYHCRKTIAAYDNSKQDYSRAIRLRTKNSVLYEAKPINDATLQYEILKDDCK
ncbi:unnamed protein product, partial [Didymodactylos carnosus]